MTPDAAMAFIHERSGYDRGFISNPFAGDEAARLGLRRTREVLARLGNPERSLPIVHVAGSKGKGSTSTFIDSIVRAAGLRSGRFLSPHLHIFRERFVVDDVPIPEPDFANLVDDVRTAVLDVEAALPEIGEVTAWELSTALAFAWFARTLCDVAVIEVGLGGTLDATNVVDPAVSVITRLDYEHTAILGTTMAEIAANKAGIIKSGRPVLSIAQPPEGMAVIVDRAAECGSPLYVEHRDWSTEGSYRSFAVRGPAWAHEHLASSLVGAHQVENAGLAVAAVHVLADTIEVPYPVADSAIRSGLATAFIPGRFEVVSARGHTIVIDGAHTPIATAALVSAFMERFPGQVVTIIAGMLTDKEPAAVLPALDAIACEWIAVPLASPRSHDVSAIVTSLGNLGIASDVAPSVDAALERVLVRPEPGFILVTGSLTTAAEARVALNLA